MVKALTAGPLVYTLLHPICHLAKACTAHRQEPRKSRKDLGPPHELL